MIKKNTQRGLKRCCIFWIVTIRKCMTHKHSSAVERTNEIALFRLFTSKWFSGFFNIYFDCARIQTWTRTKPNNVIITEKYYQFHDIKCENIVLLQTAVNVVRVSVHRFKIGFSFFNAALVFATKNENEGENNPFLYRRQAITRLLLSK